MSAARRRKTTVREAVLAAAPPFAECLAETAPARSQFDHDEAIAFEYLESVLWPEDPACPYCNFDDG